MVKIVFWGDVFFVLFSCLFSVFVDFILDDFVLLGNVFHQQGGLDIFVRDFLR